MRAALVLIAFALAAPPAGAQELGRLFLTPEQRAALDARRKARVPDKPEAVLTAAAPLKRIDGYVQRGGGKSTVWVNGETVPESARQGAARLRGAGADAGDAQVAVSLSEDNREASARVGQSIDSVTGEVRDPLGEGSIRVRRPAAARTERK